ncbi:MAG: hypothetical protein ACRC57_13370 [Sarcina sp.]
MNTFTFKNSTISNIDINTTTPVRIENSNSVISNLISTTSSVFLNGIFNCNITFKNTSNIYIDPNFSLNPSYTFLLLNTNANISYFTVTGAFLFDTTPFNISCSTNCVLDMKFTNSTQPVVLNSTIENPYSNKLILNPCNNCDNSTPISLINVSAKDLEIFRSLKVLDLSSSIGVTLTISENSFIENFRGITANTLSGVSATETIINQIKQQSVLANIPVTGTMLNLEIKNGIANFSIPRTFELSDNYSARILLGASNYQVSKQI